MHASYTISDNTKLKAVKDFDGTTDLVIEEYGSCNNMLIYNIDKVSDELIEILLPDSSNSLCYECKKDSEVSFQKSPRGTDLKIKHEDSGSSVTIENIDVQDLLIALNKLI